MDAPRPGLSRRAALRRVAWAAVGAAALSTADLSHPTIAAARPPQERGWYPKGVRPTRLYVVEESALSSAERVLVATLQGQLARRRQPDGSAPGIYVTIPGVGYEVWLADLADRYGIPLTHGDGVRDLLDRFADSTSGYVLYRGDGVNAATTVAGLTGSIAVEEGLEPLAREYGLGLVADVRDKDDRWVRQTYGSRLRGDLVIEQKPDFSNQLRDYATLTGAFTFYDGNSSFRERVVADLDPDAAVLGWGDASSGEDAFVSVSSRAGVRTIPADHARNLAPLSGISLNRVTQRRPRRLPRPEPGCHYVAFLVTDGDNIQWMLNDFQSSTRWFASPHRGSLDLGWGISPSLVDLAPSVMRWYYDHAATGAHHDSFVAGPSGGGYLYPSMYPREELELHTARLAASMERADLDVVQIIDFGSFDDTDLWATYLRHRQIAGLIYLEYSRYDTHKGRIVWANDKPVISARTMLWDGLPGADETSVTAEFNNADRDPTSPSGYSVVMWHAWSKSVANVKTVVDNLAPHVRVVTPDVLVRMVAANVRR